MARVIAEQSVSLEGFSVGANQKPRQPDGRRRIAAAEWFAGTPDAAVLDAYWSRIGAVILGRRMYEQGVAFWDGRNPWGIPVFVLTHEQREPMSNNGDILFTFVADGIESALDGARAAAGDKDGAIPGGAATIRQFIAAGQLDELHIRLVPVRSGVRLLDGVGSPAVAVQPGPVGVTHLGYRFVR